MDSTPQTTDTSLDHVLKYTGIFGGVQGLNILISIIRNKLASRLLGAAGIGLMGFYIAVSDFIHNCSNLGIPLSSVQHISELFETNDEPRIRHFIQTMRTWCLWAALLSVALCGLAAIFYDSHIMLLAPMTSALIVTGGEISLLKGLRRLKRVATISLFGAVSTFLMTIPFFWALGTRGILLSLNASTLALMGIHLAFTLPLYPWRVAPFSRATFREGYPLLRIGIPYVFAGIAGTGMTVALQTFLKEHASDTLLGYYRVGYTLMVTYAGIVFSALESDYFPRLSSVNHDLIRLNQSVNQQIRACLLLLAPMLIVLIVTIQPLLCLLYTEEFLPAAGMAICATFYMFFRCLSVPIAYIALAHGDSKIYLTMEVIYDIFSLLIIILCYQQWQLAGIGIGLSLSALFDLLLIGICYTIHYRFRFEKSTFQLTIKQSLLIGVAVVVCLLLPPILKYAVGALLFCLSALCSYTVLTRESEVFLHLRKKLHL